MSIVTLFTIKTKGASTYWDCRKLVTDITLTTDMNYTAGELDFTILEAQDGFTPKNGDEVRFWWNKKKTFLGRIFDIKYTSDEKFEVKAYDNLRYLKNEDSLIFKASSLSQRFTQVCKLANVPHKIRTGSSEKLKPVVNDGKTYFDMLKASIKETHEHTSIPYFLACSYGTIELRKAPYVKNKIVIGDKSSLEAFTFEKSIDNSYNVIRVVKSDEKSKKKVTKTAKVKKSAAQAAAQKVANTKLTKATNSGNTLDRWGTLSKVISVSGKKYNLARMKQKAANNLKIYNKQTYSLSLTCTGNQVLKAGNSVYVKIKSLKEIGLGTKALTITKSKIYFGAEYKCELEMKVRM